MIIKTYLIILIFTIKYNSNEKNDLMNILLENKNYEELVTEMIENKVEVDLILTDPPYGVSRNHQLGFSNMGRAGMDYGDWDYGFDQREW